MSDPDTADDRDDAAREDDVGVFLWGGCWFGFMNGLYCLVVDDDGDVAAAVKMWRRNGVCCDVDGDGDAVVAAASDRIPHVLVAVWTKHGC